MHRQLNQAFLSIQATDSTELIELGPSSNVSTGDASEMRAASDFWLALLLVFMAAAFLELAAMPL
jgi:hypothetical protein